MATSTASGHQVVDVLDALAGPAEIAACSLAIIGGNGIRLLRARSYISRSFKAQIHEDRSPKSRHCPVAYGLSRAELLPCYAAFQYHHARRGIGLHAVFGGDENVKVLVRGGCLQAAFQIFIDS